MPVSEGKWNLTSSPDFRDNYQAILSPSPIIIQKAQYVREGEPRNKAKTTRPYYASLIPC